MAFLEITGHWKKATLLVGISKRLWKRETNWAGHFHQFELISSKILNICGKNFVTAHYLWKLRNYFNMKLWLHTVVTHRMTIQVSRREVMELKVPFRPLIETMTVGHLLHQLTPGTHWWVGCFPSWHQATRSLFNSCIDRSNVSKVSCSKKQQHQSGLTGNVMPATS